VTVRINRPNVSQMSERLNKGHRGFVCLDRVPFSMIATEIPNGRPLTGPSDPVILLRGDG
jgi:hypothetical protein